MPRYLFKGDAARELDKWYRRGNVFNNLQAADNLLSANASLATVVGNARANPDNPWNGEAFDFPSHPPLTSQEFERVAHHGYRKAIELALEHSPPAPISTFWLTGAGNPTFEMHIVDAVDADDADDGPGHVSVIVAIPDSAISETSGTPSFAWSGPASWVVIDEGEENPSVRQTSGSGMGKPPQP